MDASDVLAAARIKAVRVHPYLSAALFGLRPVRREGLGTCAVDAGMRLWYDPDFVVKWGAAAMSTVLVHEVMHVMRRHMKRLGQRDPQRWNIAADMEINDDIVSAGWSWPKDVQVCLPSMCGLDDGLTAEEYYELLPRKPQDGEEIGRASCRERV